MCRTRLGWSADCALGLKLGYALNQFFVALLQLVHADFELLNLVVLLTIAWLLLARINQEGWLTH
jgi:hypothetical protein